MTTQSTFRHRFAFAPAADALAEAHEVSDARNSAFRARLKHYQKQGFPKGINTGRGRSATYTVQHVLKLAMALELNQLGLTPERAMHVIARNMDRIINSIKYSLSDFDGEDRLQMFIYFEPNALIDLTDSKMDSADLTFNYVGRVDLAETISRWGPKGVRRIAVINISTMVQEVLRALAKHTSSPLESILQDATDWVDRSNF